MKMKVRVLKDLGTHKPGDIVDVEFDWDGNATDRFWRRRLKDSKIDNCVEFVEDKKPHKKEVKKDESKGENR